MLESLVSPALRMVAGTGRWLRPFWLRLTRGWRLDHAPIEQGGSVVHTPLYGRPDGARILIECAPSRTLHRRHFSPAKAIVIAEQAFPLNGTRGESSEGNGVRIQHDGGGMYDYLWLLPSGKIQYSLVVPIDNRSGRRTLDVLDLLEPVRQTYALATSRDFAEIYGRRGMGPLNRIDWRIFTSGYSSMPDSSHVASWADLRFPGPGAARGQSDRTPECPTRGHGTDDLRGTHWRRSDLTRTLTTFLSAFLADNGFHDYGSAVESSVQSAQERADVLASAPAQG